MNLAVDTARAAELLAAEALALDMRRWDDWLALYTPDAVFWMPSWKNEDDLVDDPESEMSLFYYTSRADLEDRVWRLRQQRSAASRPLLRTVHGASNLVLLPGDGAGPGRRELRAAWTCHVFHPKRSTANVFFGRYEITVDTSGPRWLIARKKAILMNDYIPNLMDFYCC